MSSQNFDNSKLEAVSNGRMALLTGGIAAILASACCLGPLVLLLLGFSGAWISNLTALERYSPVFIGLALVALLFAGRRIWRPVNVCEPGAVCSLPQVRRSYQILFGLIALLVLIALAFPLIAPFFY